MQRFVSFSRWFSTFALLFLLVFFTTSAGLRAQTTLYWTNGGGLAGVHRVGLDGSGLTTIVDDAILFGGVQGSNFPRGVAVDEINGKVYWGERSRSLILRVNVDGTAAETLLDLEPTYGIGSPEGLAVDPVAGKLFWIYDTSGPTALYCSDLDGSNVQPVVANLGQQGVHLSLDRLRRKIYMAHGSGFGGANDEIQVVDYDGNNLTDLITKIAPPAALGAIVVDPFGCKLYWGDVGNDKVIRADLDGSDPEDILVFNDGSPDLSNPWGLAVDPVAGKIYVLKVNQDKIMRADLDGSNLKDFVLSPARPQFAAIDVPYSGPRLAMDLEPNTVMVGDTVVLRTCGGTAGSPTTVLVTHIDGVPSNTLLTAFIGPFDASGQRLLSGAVPIEGQGLEITFQAIALDPVDGIIDSNSDVLSIQ
jgi:DNA-binding beta-propeller fold protein YncE